MTSIFDLPIQRKKERIYFSKVIIKHQNRHSIKIINSERIDKRHIERPLIVYPVYINNSGYLNKIMIKIKYLFDFLIFSLKRRYFGYKKTIVLGGSPSIEALSPLLENIYNCGKKTKKNKKQRYLENYKDLEAHIFRVYSQLIYGCRAYMVNHCIEKKGNVN